MIALTKEPCNLCQQRVVRVVDMEEFINSEIARLRAAVEDYREKKQTIALEASRAKIADAQHLHQIITLHGLEAVNKAVAKIAAADPFTMGELREDPIVDALLKWEGR